MTPEQTSTPDPNAVPEESQAETEESVSTEAQTVEASTQENTASAKPEVSETKKTESEKTEPENADSDKAKSATEVVEPIPVSRLESLQSNEVVRHLTAVGAELWRQAKPVLQVVGTQALIFGNRTTDFLLDKAFPFAKEKFIQVLPQDFKVRAQEKIDPVTEKVVPVWKAVWPWIQKIFGPLWTWAIAFVRGKLPQDLSVQLSNRFLNILLVTTIYLTWSVFSGLTHPSQAQPSKPDQAAPQVNYQPPSDPVEVTPAPAPERSASPEVSTPDVSLEPQTKPTPQVAPTPNPSVSSSASNPISTPQPEEPNPEVTSDSSPDTQSAPAPAVSGADTNDVVDDGPDLVVLKSNLASAMNRVVENAAEMIESVSVNDDELVVALGDRWYQLSYQDQSKLADALLSKSKRLEYERLDIRDADNDKVGRSPFVGDHAIILKRSLPGEKMASFVTSTEADDFPEQNPSSQPSLQP